MLKKRPRKSTKSGAGKAAEPKHLIGQPSPTVSEPAFRALHKLMKGKNFKNINEANAFLEQVTSSGQLQAMMEAEGSPEERAADLAIEAMNASSREEALRLAEQALALDPGCVDALLVRTDCTAKTGEEFLAQLERVVRVGAERLGPDFIAENKGHFWGILETRPLMRAKQRLADTYLLAGEVLKAIRSFEEMLDLNPSDNQGVRYALLGVYLQIPDLRAAERLMGRYEDDAAAEWAWGKVLYAHLSGDDKAARRALTRAMKVNRYFPEVLFTRKPSDRLPESYTLGSQEEAAWCAWHLGRAWMGNIESALWLDQQRRGAKPTIQ